MSGDGLHVAIMRRELREVGARCAGYSAELARASRINLPRSTAVSTGQRNTLAESLGRCFEVLRFAVPPRRRFTVRGNRSLCGSANGEKPVKQQYAQCE
jgi:hypothetical protein